ncbi:hypothetical protein [Methylobacterium oryzisoli]|uniref:hypothetical protein n=1 Tax=Methylobacterium oryzisoli TaxID=3385502 RepID=UPI0038921559
MLIQNDLIAFYQSGVTLGATYLLLSPGAIGDPMGERLPSLKWIAIGCVAGFAALLVVLLSAYAVDTSAFVAAIPQVHARRPALILTVHRSDRARPASTAASVITFVNGVTCEGVVCSSGPSEWQLRLILPARPSRGGLFQFQLPSGHGPRMEPVDPDLD